MVFTVEKKVIFIQNVDIEAQNKNEALEIAQQQDAEPSKDMYFWDNYILHGWKVSEKNG